MRRRDVTAVGIVFGLAAIYGLGHWLIPENFAFVGSCYDDSLPASKQREQPKREKALVARLERDQIKPAKKIALDFAKKWDFPAGNYIFDTPGIKRDEWYEFEVFIARRKDLAPLCASNMVMSITNSAKPNRLEIVWWNGDLVGEERLNKMATSVVERMRTELGLEFREQPEGVPMSEAYDDW